MRGATLRKPVRNIRNFVSIHAPHAGRDNALPSSTEGMKVSIHAPHAGRDLALAVQMVL